MDDRVSIEISTFNNKEVLRLVLERLAQQTFPPADFCVVISDDGSQDGLLDMVEAMRGELPYALKIVRNEHRGAAENHNQGIRACDEGIVIMLAADILASPDLVAEHVASHRQHGDASTVVVGKLVQSPELPQTVFQQSWDRLVNLLFSAERKELRHGGFFVSNLSFKKSFMLEHGMFLDWPPAAQEDIELGYRLARNGMTLVTNPRALGYHHHRATPDGVSRRAYNEGYNWHYLEDRLGELWLRSKTGHVGLDDGVGVYLHCQVKTLLRILLLNRVTVSTLIVPLIKAAERYRFLAPLVPVLAGKLASYYFYRGLSDYRNNLPLRADAIRI